MLKKAVLLNDGVVTNAILVDPASDFDPTSLGYILADDLIEIGWVKTHDGFRPSDESIETDRAPVEYVGVSISYLKELHRKSVAKQAGDAALLKAREDGKSEEEAAIIAQSAYDGVISHG